MTEFSQEQQEQYEKFFAEFEKAYKEYENKVKERRARGIHDYNVFDVLETKEVKHSKFIASLLDPKGLHYQGDLFLREFIKACEIDDFGLDTLNSQVFREYKNIDIYITDGYKHIIIENKIWDAKDQDKQIYRYIETIKDENTTDKEIYSKILVLYLTPNFDKTPSQESLNGFKIKDSFLEKDNDKIRYKHIVCDDILEWLNKVKIEIVNLTDLNVIITQYEKAVKNLINKGEKMENKNLIELVKQNYKISKEISKVIGEAEKEIINEIFDQVRTNLESKIDKGNWKLKFHEIDPSKKFFSITLNDYNEGNHDGNFIYYCAEPQSGYNNIIFGLKRSNNVKNELNDGCFKNIVENSNYCKSWKNSEWWACYYEKFKYSNDLILEYLDNNDFSSKIADEICEDLEQLKDILKNLNEELISKNKQ